MKDIVCYLQGQGQKQDLHNQNITASTRSSELLVFLQPDLVWWCIIIGQNVQCKDWKMLTYCFCEHARFLCGSFYASFINFYSFVHMVWQHCSKGLNNCVFLLVFQTNLGCTRSSRCTAVCPSFPLFLMLQTWPQSSLRYTYPALSVHLSHHLSAHLDVCWLAVPSLI